MSKKMRKILFLIIAAAVMIALTIWMIPWVISLRDEAVQAQFKQYVSSLGAGGWFLMLGAQILQVVVAAIPGEPIEVVAGMLYGPWGGLATCLLGIWISSAAIFWAVRRLGRRFVAMMLEEKDLKKLSFLNKRERLEQITFILFLIPGTPKDMLTYAAGLTPIPFLRFLVISTFARIPSVLSSTFAGASIVKGDWLTTAIIFAAAGVIGLLGIHLHNRITERLNKKKQA